MPSILSFSLVSLAGTAFQALASPHGILQSRQDETPSVDLGYEVHTATENVRKRSPDPREHRIEEYH